MSRKMRKKRWSVMCDKIEEFFGALIQHGGLSDRIYLMKAGEAEAGVLIGELDRLASEKGYTKIFAKVRDRYREDFERTGYVSEARVPGFYMGSEDCFFMGKFFSDERKRASDVKKLDEVLVLAKNKGRVEGGDIKCEGGKIRICTKDDAGKMSEIYREVFDSYPFPIDDPNYLKEMMDDNVVYFGVECDGELAALSSAEMYEQSGNVEMTDFATLSRWRGQGFGVCLLSEMGNRMRQRCISTSYTIARAISPGMNITFSKMGYNYAGRLVNNTNISGQIESMNVWYKSL